MHLHECKDCRALLHDFEQIVLVDLTTIAAESTREQPSAEFGLHNPERILARMLQQVDEQPEVPIVGREPAASQHKLQRTLRLLIPNSPIGWAVACVALIAVGVAIQSAATTQYP